uniref:RNA helicase n=1 Tax=Globodera rostochiensis TaxID=31243 RepID=A0A914HHJ1_GLORO
MIFSKRFSDTDEDYLNALKTVAIEPICISPWKTESTHQRFMENERFSEGRGFAGRGRRGFYNKNNGNFRKDNYGRRQDYHAWN